METQTIKILSSWTAPEESVAFLVMGDWMRPICSNEDLVRVHNNLVTDPSVSLETDSGVVSRLEALEDLPPTSETSGGEDSDVNSI